MSKKKIITSIITGDIINSRKNNTKLWLPVLKKTLARTGQSPQNWEIFRGDSFQVEVKNPADALLTAILIKAHIKAIKNLDVRMAIGIGEKDFTANNITESNGEAFIHSGERLESLKQEKQNLAVKSRWPDFDRDINLYLRLALIAMDNWSTSAADLIKILLDNPDITQMKLATKLKITQSAVSGRQKRAYYNEVKELEVLYREKITNLLRTI
ncbi:MAG: SatD family protein [Cyclobacteriaceae bacterium]|nr:SatD family protein [Cyclobacteriaceae bacterium]